MSHFILVHDNGDKSSAVLFTDRQSLRSAFKKIDQGQATAYELSRSQAIKRANFNIEHKENKNALASKNDVQLRAEAKKRNLSIADNPQATRDQIIGEIQQHELTNRIQHRRPLESTTKLEKGAAPKGKAGKE